MLLGRIDLFPIKSLDAVSVAAARVNDAGILDHDRVYAIVDEAGSYVNGKRTGRIHLIRTIFADDFREACFWIQGDAKKQNFVLSEPQKINQWLSAFFGFSARLVFEPNNGFPDDRVANGPTITSAGSLEEIVRWFPELTLEGTRRRFRTNLELAVGEPFWEDRLFGESNELKPFRIGDISLFGHNPCQRCVVPSRDPESGIQSLPSFQKTFMALREKCLPAWADIRRFNHFYRFAINTSIPHAFAGEFLRVGDRLTF